MGDALLEEIAQILQREVTDPRVGFVTLTAVRVSPDLRIAKVHYSVLGDQATRAACAEGLASASSFIRRAVGHRLSLKNVPELRFVHDDSLDRAFRIDELIEDAQHEPEDPRR